MSSRCQTNGRWSRTRCGVRCDGPTGVALPTRAPAKRCLQSCRVGLTRNCGRRARSGCGRWIFLATPSVGCRWGRDPQRWMPRCGRPCLTCRPTGHAISWVSGSRATSSRRWRRGSICSTACCQRDVVGRGWPTRSTGWYGSKMPATRRSSGRWRKAAPVWRVGTAPATSAICFWPVRCSGRSWPRSTTSRFTSGSSRGFGRRSWRGNSLPLGLICSGGVPEAARGRERLMASGRCGA